MPDEHASGLSAATAGTTAQRRLPLGIQTFSKIREDECYYVDKTRFIARMVEEGTHFFLSRPRRFGKSLLLDTVKELFEGNEPLFRGLAVHDTWDWSAIHPVVRLSFGAGTFTEADHLRIDALDQIDTAAQQAAVPLPEGTAAVRFRHLLRTLHARDGRRVVVLVDEYDKPILDALDYPDIARANRDFLRGLYATIKDCDAHVRFTLLTGVSRFSKVNLFSGLNNLSDITLDARYSAICGYTEADLDTVFAPELDGLDRSEIRAWYDGYRWLGEESVYNPYDVLLLFDHRAFRPWWFDTGTPTFLVDTLVREGLPAFALEELIGSETLLSSFDVGAIDPIALLFQTGYLTVRGTCERAGREMYRLGYPNREVRQCLNEHLLAHAMRDSLRREAHASQLHDALVRADFEAMRAALDALFAGIPHQWHTNNPMAGYEGWYASVFYASFAALGVDVRVEDSTSTGRLDMAVLTTGHIYLLELKVAGRAAAGAALAQLQAKGYAEKYRASGRPVHLVGVELDAETRAISSFDVALD